MPFCDIQHPQNQAVPNQVCHPAAGANLGEFLDYCNALLTGLPACVVKPLQMIQNAAARLVFNQPKRANVTLLLIELHWLPVAARIKFNSLMLAYRLIAGSAPTYLNALVRPNVIPRMLRSSSERRLALPSASMAIQTILICSSTLVERTTKHYQSRGVPLYLLRSS